MQIFAHFNDQSIADLVGLRTVAHFGPYVRRLSIHIKGQFYVVGIILYESFVAEIVDNIPSFEDNDITLRSYGT